MNKQEQGNVKSNTIFDIDKTNEATKTIPELKGTAGKLELSEVLKVTKPLMKGAEVENLQKALIEKGFHCGAAGITGVFTKDTAVAVRQFQGMNGLIVSGKVDKTTVEKLGGVWKGKV